MCSAKIKCYYCVIVIAAEKSFYFIFYLKLVYYIFIYLLIFFEYLLYLWEDSLEITEITEWLFSESKRMIYFEISGKKPDLGFKKNKKPTRKESNYTIILNRIWPFRRKDVKGWVKWWKKLLLIKTPSL